MAQDVLISFDLRQFNQTLRRYVDTTSKSRARALNGKAYEIAARAERHTRRADRMEIESLGVIGTKVRRDRKTGALKKGANIYGTNTRARDIVVGKIINAGGALPGKAEIDRLSRTLISRRLSAIGYLASGWIPAIRKLFRFADFKQPRPTSRKRGEDKGYAIPAAPKQLTATIANTVEALSEDRPRTLAERALARGFMETEVDMEAYLLRKEKEAARASGIEVH